MIGRLKPYAQRNMLKTLRALVTFALAEGLIDVDPTVGVKLAGVRDSGGFATWDETHIAQYRATHPLGSRARLALELLFCSMQRRGDVVRIGRQHVRDGALTLRQQKTGTQVDIPVLAELQAAIDAMPRADHLTFLVTDADKPFTAAGFGNWFREQCNLAGLPKNLSASELHITLAPLSSPNRTHAAQALCEMLDQMATIFPGSRLRIRFAVRPPPRLGLAFPGSPVERSTAPAVAPVR
jgi:integrase